MFKKRLAQLFLVIMTLQSVAAFADIHQSHQSGDQHLSFEHEHQDLNQHINHQDIQENSKIGQPSATDFDCHHCCHCHGVHHHWIVTNLASFQIYSYSPTMRSAEVFFPNSLQENLLRPPIFSHVI